MYFNDIQSVEYLRVRYLELARRYHPDVGGNTRVMQLLNLEYRSRREFLESNREGFQQLNLGDTVFVNGTECFVVSLSEKTFEAQAKGRERRAIFDKYSGRCITDRKFKAQYQSR